MARIQGSDSPWLVQPSGDGRYLVRFDIVPNSGIYGAAAFGTNYEEVAFDHLPTLDEIRETVGRYYRDQAREAAAAGFDFGGRRITLQGDSWKLAIQTGLLTLQGGGADFPLVLLCGAEEVSLDDADALRSLLEADEAHRRQCSDRLRQQLAAVDWLEYDNYLNAFHDMTELEKLKLEKKVSVIRARESRAHYYVDDADVYVSSYTRRNLEDRANRGEAVRVNGVEMPAKTAQWVLADMAAHTGLLEDAYLEKLAAIEKAASTEEVEAISADGELPEPPRTTQAAVEETIATEEANSPAVQAVLFAKQVINDVPMTATLALQRKVLFPVWGEEGAEMGRQVAVGFRFRYGDDLYEVIQAHALQADWVPGMTTASLYKIVSEDHAGTLDDPIPYVQGMAFEEGKYYEQYGTVYRCILTTQTGYPNDLKDLTTIVERVDE